MNQQVLVSVLLPVFNAEEYLEQTLQSLITQTYKNFEVIAINDGSTDRSQEILERYAKFDERIKVTNQQNLGLVMTLNKAASIAQGEFMARIDADDIALPRRFELQVAELNNHPSCVVVGSCFDVMNEDGEILYHDAVPTIKEDILNAFYVRNPLAHGSVMMRKKAFIKAGQYSSECGPTEDYALWLKMLEIGEIRVLSNFLFRWRVNPNGITSTKSKTMEKFMKINFDAYWNYKAFRVVSRKELRRRCNYYLSTNTQHGIGQKHAVLHDLCEVSLKLVKRGRYFDAFRQILIVASTGRTGFKIAKDRVLKALHFHTKNKLSSIPGASV